MRRKKKRAATVRSLISAPAADGSRVSSGAEQPAAGEGPSEGACEHRSRRAPGRAPAEARLQRAPDCRREQG
eukprot:3240519-Heterocapsa_arctica.AAC.1